MSADRVCLTILVESCFIISVKVIAQNLSRVFDLQEISRADFRPAQRLEKKLVKTGCHVLQ